MRVAELIAIVREHGLRGYSRLRKAKLIALLHPAWAQGPQRPLGPTLWRSTRGPLPPASSTPLPPQVQARRAPQAEVQLVRPRP